MYDSNFTFLLFSFKLCVLLTCVIYCLHDITSPSLSSTTTCSFRLIQPVYFCTEILEIGDIQTLTCKPYTLSLFTYLPIHLSIFHIYIISLNIVYFIFKNHRICCVFFFSNRETNEILKQNSNVYIQYNQSSLIEFLFNLCNREKKR